MAAIPQNANEYKGPANDPLQVLIPPWMLGEEFQEDRHGTYEDKAAVTSTKGEAMGHHDEKYKAFKQSTQQGFSRLDPSSLSFDRSCLFSKLKYVSPVKYVINT